MSCKFTLQCDYKLLLERMKIMNRHFKALSVVCCASLLLAGCGSSQTTASVSDNTSVANASTVSADYADLFSNRDLSNDYDASAAIPITLEGSSASCASSAVTIDGSTVTITEEGTYLLSGSLDNGMILVDTDKLSKVQLVLDNVTISNNTSAAIYVRQADKVFITTVKDSQNVLQNGGTYETIDDNNIDAVIFSKDDLTLNGYGSLTIEAAEGMGVVSKDDLIITGGTYTITSKGDGLSGKDVLGIYDGTFTITSDGDAIRSKVDLYIAGGTYDLTCGDGYENGRTHQEDFPGGMGHPGGDFQPDGNFQPDENFKPGDDFQPDENFKPDEDFQPDENFKPDKDFQWDEDSTDRPTPPERADSDEQDSRPQPPERSDSSQETNTAQQTEETADSSKESDSLQASENTDSTEDTPSTKGLKADGNLVLDGGTYTINTADDCIHSNSSIQINDGTYELASGDDAVHADAELTVNGGTVSVSNSYEGLEGAQVTINDGTVTVNASDDGVNASLGTGAFVEEDCVITVNGGILTVNADGDGIDSNGSIIQNGGEMYICGPTNSANAAIDFATDIEINGGILLAVDNSQMQEQIDSAPKQGLIRTTIDQQEADTTIILKTEDGEELLRFTPSKTYSTVTVSLPELIQGNTYLITTGNEVTNITMDSSFYDDIKREGFH